MKQKTRLLIEFLVVMGAMIFAFIAVLPSFLKVQQGRFLVETFENADLVLSAEMLYRLDGGTLEQSFANPNKTTRYEKIDPEPLGNAVFRCLREKKQQRKDRLENHYQMLMSNGSLVELPDFSFIDLEGSSIINDDLFYTILSKPVYGKKTDTRFRVLKCYFALFNPMASKENQQEFFAWKDFARLNKYAYNVGLYEPAVDPSDFYDPSNGMDSAGFIYIDNFGNHSPFGKETPRLRILEFQKRIREE